MVIINFCRKQKCMSAVKTGKLQAVMAYHTFQVAIIAGWIKKSAGNRIVMLGKLSNSGVGTVFIDEPGRSAAIDIPEGNSAAGKAFTTFFGRKWYDLRFNSTALYPNACKAGALVFFFYPELRFKQRHLYNH